MTIRQLQQPAAKVIDQLAEAEEIGEITRRGRDGPASSRVSPAERALAEMLERGEVIPAKDPASLAGWTPLPARGGQGVAVRRAHRAARGGARLIYFDTCALLKLIRSDAQSVALGAFIDARPATRWFTSELARTELARTVRRANHDDRGRLADAARLRAELQPRRAPVGAARPHRGQHPGCSPRPPPSSSRSCAPLTRSTWRRPSSLRASLSAFVTYDKRLAAAAGEIGLPVLSPA